MGLFRIKIKKKDEPKKEPVKEVAEKKAAPAKAAPTAERSRGCLRDTSANHQIKLGSRPPSAPF